MKNLYDRLKPKIRKSIQDDLKKMDEDTIYFIISTLNQLNIGSIRNKILLKVLPLKV